MSLGDYSYFSLHGMLLMLDVSEMLFLFLFLILFLPDNVFNSNLKGDFKFPWTSSTLQLILGLFYAIPLWFLKVRKIPNLTSNDVLRLLPIAALNALGHVSAVIAMFQKGGGSFTHVIKASEPVVSVILSFFINGVIPKPLTALSLLPVTYGVAYASTLGNINVKSISKELTSTAAK
jgi:solute carrier family 35 protein E1